MAIFSGAWSAANLYDSAPDAGQTAFLPHGWLPILFALPFAMWFFLGIEELPLAAEEAHKPAKDIPRAGIWGMVTLVIFGGIVLVLNPGLTGSDALSTSGEPLLDGFRAIVPEGLAAILSAFALIGLLASLQGIMFAYGRNMYSLSRAGYYPKFLSLTGKRQTPWVALLVGGLIGFSAGIHPADAVVRILPDSVKLRGYCCHCGGLCHHRKAIVFATLGRRARARLGGGHGDPKSKATAVEAMRIMHLDLRGCPATSEVFSSRSM
jgi:amino acid transporter